MPWQSNPLGDVGCRRILAVMPAVFPMLQVVAHYKCPFLFLRGDSRY
jgi:hypothetical protein